MEIGKNNGGTAEIDRECFSLILLWSGGLAELTMAPRPASPNSLGLAKAYYRSPG